MVFSSFLFLFGFLPVFFACYLLTPVRFKNLVALLWSYLFYAWGAPTVVFVLLVTTAIDYPLGKAIADNRDNPGRKKFFLICSLAANLSCLLYFKYANFFVEQLNAGLKAFDVPVLSWSDVALPVGISFFTFHKISYIVDVYRGIVEPARNFINYSLYITLFPQLIAGPIIRYHDINDQILSRKHDLQTMFYGVYRFSIGLGKKVLIADTMGRVADNVWGTSFEQVSTFYAWLGILCYAHQIYFDFSGYSDMAIGLGKMMGFHFLENFDKPYISQNFTEFWRRWHISLSRWMREYLYIPLGGNRVPAWRMYLNLWVVFLLSGLWHGANWTFVFWGAYHGLFLALDKLFWLRMSPRFGKGFNVALTYFLVLIGWVFFRNSNIGNAFEYLAHMFDVWRFGNVGASVLWGTIIHNRAIFIFCLATLLTFVPASSWWQKTAGRLKERSSEIQIAYARFALGFLCFVLSAMSLTTTNYNPFIYFRF